MNPSSSNTRPYWFDEASLPRQPQLSGQVSVDVCIIGAGITGLTAADLLKRAGRTVAVIDLARIGSGETSHTSAHLTEVPDIGFRDLISRFGQDDARLATEAARRAIERIQESAFRYGIDCDFTRGPGYQFTERPEEVARLEEEAQAALRLGVANELVTESPLPFKIARAIRYADQAQFHPLKYLYGLAQRIPGNGSAIFEETRMIDVEEGEPCRVMTDRGTIVAENVLVAANVPSTNRFFLHTKIAAYRTYALAARLAPTSEKIPSLDSLFWDLEHPYHYIRSVSRGDENFLIIGGEDHKTGQGESTNVHFQKLEDWAREHFPIDRVTHHWSGQIIEPVDGLPYIGRNPLSDHVFVATGYSGNGLTMGTVAGMLVSDLIIGHENPWAELFDAGRVKPLASMKNFLSENIDFPSHLIGDRLSQAQLSSSRRLRENEGAIIRVGAKKVAAYRDTEGAVHLLSPVCPHLGCHVNWNDAEKSWDCPCHGARFDPRGKLLNGPAVQDLSPEQIDDDTAVVTEPLEQPIGLEALGAPLLSFFSCPCKA